MSRLLLRCCKNQLIYRLFERDTVRYVEFSKGIPGFRRSSSFDPKFGVSASSGCHQRRFFSSTTRTNDKKSSSNAAAATATDGLTSTVYIHPLSQIILEYLQDCHHDWIVHHGLDHDLTLHRDGSFVLKFSPSASIKGSLGVNQASAESKAGAASSMQSINDDVATRENSTSDNNDLKIWTSYDEEGKKHWLTVQKQTLHQRFLLQDNLLPAWHGNRGSLPERIHSSVDAMIRAVDRLETAKEKQLQQLPRRN